MIFNSTSPEFNPDFLNPDRCYKSTDTYDDVIEFLKKLKSMDENNSFSLSEKILVIEVDDGVFVRSKNLDICAELTQLSKHPDELFPKFDAITEREWNNVTTKYKVPIKSFGDDSLARWKIGF